MRIKFSEITDVDFLKKWKRQKTKEFYLVAIIFLSIVLFSIFMISSCEAGEVDMSIIAEIESGNNPEACSFLGCKYGRGTYQISEIVLKEWNSFFPQHKYTKEDLFNPSVNSQIANWYMQKRIPSMIKHYKKLDTLENRLIAYNAGISYVAHDKNIPKETLNYILKYKKIEEYRK